jgi:hypothetical protein
VADEKASALPAVLSIRERMRNVGMNSAPAVAYLVNGPSMVIVARVWSAGKVHTLILMH